MRAFSRVLIGVAVLALAGCVYPGYSYVRGDAYAGGYYTGNPYYYDDGYYYGPGYGCCDYGPTVSLGIGYYGGYYGRGYRGYRGHRGGYYRGGHDWRHGDRHDGERRHH